MFSFEKVLIDNGYIKHKLNQQLGIFEQVNEHEDYYSTMNNLYFYFFHKDNNNKNLLNSIIFGINESLPTLIYPRPFILKRNNKIIFNIKDSDIDRLLSKYGDNVILDLIKTNKIKTFEIC